jgi:serine/threonine protein kinase
VARVIEGGEMVGSGLGPGGRYTVRALVARGGFGAVYRAWDTSLQREVALKVLIPTLLHEPAFVERFRREALAVASLRHRHILEVYDFGEQADGTLYLVMPLIEGGTLKERFQQQGRAPWSGSEAHSLAAQLLPALDFAHDHGIVHRDVKPANVLLERDWAWLADFGIARMALGDSGGATLSGASAIGTPEYMAPEQVVADPARPLDGRADLYAFGVVLYELLTGRVPFKGETTWETCYQVLQAPLPRPRELNPLVPEPIEAVLLRALARDRDERFGSGAELEAALGQALSEDATRTPPLPHRQDGPTIIRREPAPVVRSGLPARLVRALKLDNSVYDEVREDSSTAALLQAAAIVAVSALLFGATSASIVLAESPFVDHPVSSAIGGLFGGLAGWAVWSFMCAAIGTGLFKGSGTTGQVLRTSGLAQIPSIFVVVAFVPSVGGLLYTPFAVWALLAEIGAVRQTLKLATPTAVLTLFLAGIVSTSVQWLIAIIVARVVAPIT